MLSDDVYRKFLADTSVSLYHYDTTGHKMLRGNLDEVPQTFRKGIDYLETSDANLVKMTELLRHLQE